MYDNLDDIFDDVASGGNEPIEEVEVPFEDGPGPDADADVADLTLESKDLYGSGPTEDVDSLGMSNDDDDDNPTHEDDENPDDEENSETPAQHDLIAELLKAKGIEDPKAIKYEDEEGNIIDVDFDTLSFEEKLAILNTDDADINYGLEESEVQVINFLRHNDVSFEDAVKYYQKQAVQEYIDSQNIVGLEVDQYTNEELYVMDMKAKFNNLTDAEIEIELSRQLEHPELFQKKVDKLRTEYKEIEQQQLEDSRLEKEREEEQKFETFKGSLINVAQSTLDIGGLDLDNNDKNEVLTYLLDKDINGVSSFTKDNDNPEKLFKMAWYATKGEEAFEVLHDYYRKEIEKVSRASYEKGKKESTKTAPKQEVQATRTNKVVVKEPANNGFRKQSKTISINDLLID